MFRRMLFIGFLLGLAMSVLSAWIRIADTGYDCEPWPVCYGQIVIIDPEPGITITPTDSNRPLRVAHRLMASVFGLVVIVLATSVAWNRMRGRTVPGVGAGFVLLAFSLTMLLSVVGMNTPDVQRPLVMTINLTGGMLLTLVMFHLWLEVQRPSTVFPLEARMSAAVTVLTLCAVVSGAWVSANFGAVACEGRLFTCEISLEVADLAAFSLARELRLENGSVVAGRVQDAVLFIHQAMVPLAAMGVVLTLLPSLLLKWRWQAFIVAPGFTLCVLLLVSVIEMVWPSTVAAFLHSTLSLLLMMSLVYQVHCLRRLSSGL